jgi:dsRNA-specific ribonuclease
VVGRGSGRSKQAASQSAAQNALERLENGLVEVK